jgi:ATP/ADP translocase
MFMLLLSFGFNTLVMAMAVQIVVRAFNYGFNEPVREMLYIPTSHKIQFGAKGWVDTFGKTLSKGSGAGLNLLAAILPPAAGNLLGLAASLVIGGGWLLIATLVGKAYHEAVAEHKVIGSSVENN